MRVVILICALLLAQKATASVRRITLKNDELLTVKTALGIATLVQVPGPIQSAIIGDQSGFKVEYLDRAVTIKPLRFGAKTNLYLFTESRRFNLRLITQTQDAADYVVYIKEPSLLAAPKWQPLSLSKSGNAATLLLSRISTTPQGFVLIEGSLITKDRVLLRPEQIWLRQGSESKTIQHLYLSDTSAAKDRPILIGLSVHMTDLQAKSPITIEVLGTGAWDSLAITVPESSVWR